MAILSEEKSSKNSVSRRPHKSSTCDRFAPNSVTKSAMLVKPPYSLCMSMRNASIRRLRTCATVKF